jgi:hypothetical protein
MTGAVTTGVEIAGAKAAPPVIMAAILLIIMGFLKENTSLFCKLAEHLPYHDLSL